MVDNVGYTPGTCATIAADDIGGVLHQRVKLGVGGDGVAVDVSAANPLPVSDEDVARLLVRVLNLLGAPVNYDPALNRQRMTAILESGTLTTVGTLTDITNFGAGRTASELQNNQALAAWAACHASRVF
jgi:hypothetical protein